MYSSWFFGKKTKENKRSRKESEPSIDTDFINLQNALAKRRVSSGQARKESKIGIIEEKSKNWKKSTVDKSLPLVIDTSSRRSIAEITLDLVKKVCL